MDKKEFWQLRNKVVAAGFGLEIIWSESLRPCEDPDEFFNQYLWVVIHSGMNHKVARKIEAKVRYAIDSGIPIEEVFNNKMKVKAIKEVFNNRADYFNKYKDAGSADEKLAVLQTFPMIGPIIKFHLAKNLGLDFAKPDRHLERIAAKDGRDCQTLCRDLANETDYRISTVDLILWRASEQGFLKD